MLILLISYWIHEDDPSSYVSLPEGKRNPDPMVYEIPISVDVNKQN